MALPIKPTPHLKGNDAKKFTKKMKSSEEKKINSSVRTRMEKNYKEMYEAFKKHNLL